MLSRNIFGIEKQLLEEDPFKDILGQQNAKKQLKSALLAGRNICILGPPGIGKTTLAKNVAKLLPEHKGKKALFIRVQGSPDLTAEDLFGDIDPIKALKFGPLSTEAFTPGKIFKANNGVLFFDELNRAPEKLQNALLQVLEEKKATLGGYDVDFETNFIFIATMNPNDTSTEKISDVLLDRFDMVYITYPETVEIEKQIVRLKGANLGAEFSDALLAYCIAFIHDLRNNKSLEMVPSVRASLGLYERAQSNALIAKRKAVEFNDIKEAMESVLTHRIRLKPSVRYLESPVEFIRKEFENFKKQNPKIGKGEGFERNKGGEG